MGYISMFLGLLVVISSLLERKDRKDAFYAAIFSKYNANDLRDIPNYGQVSIYRTVATCKLFAITKITLEMTITMKPNTNNNKLIWHFSVIHVHLRLLLHWRSHSEYDSECNFKHKQIVAVHFVLVSMLGRRHRRAECRTGSKRSLICTLCV